MNGDAGQQGPPQGPGQQPPNGPQPQHPGAPGQGWGAQGGWSGPPPQGAGQPGPPPQWQPQGPPPQQPPGSWPGYEQPGYEQPGYGQPGYEQPGPQGPYPPGPPVGGDGSSKNRSGALIAVLSLLLLLVAALAGFLLLRDGGDDDVAGGETFVKEDGEIFLEPAADIGPDPFTDDFKAEPPPPTLASEPQPEETRIEAPPDVTVTADDGATPGLYGGTRDNARCDRDGIADFLEANPDKAAAWAGALNADPTLRWSGGSTIAVNEIRGYLAELTPVTLRTDTRVTNHGYAGGRATPRQSVLQAGTAVLVDAYGVPRARCGCGNPLLPPQPSRVRPVYVGRPWPGFSPVNVTVINQTTTIINVIQIIDIDTGDTFVRPTGTIGRDDRDPTGTTTAPTTPPDATTTAPTVPPDLTLGTGDVQVTLLWSSGADLDLHVIDPEGAEISYSSSSSPSGGQLDHDEIPTCGDNATHAENVFWPEGGAPSGEYQAFVRHFSSCGGPASYVLEVRVGGQVVASDSGSLGDGADSPAITFSGG